MKDINLGLAYLGEGIALSGIGIGVGISGNLYMWILVVFWAFNFGPKHSGFKNEEKSQRS